MAKTSARYPSGWRELSRDPTSVLVEFWFGSTRRIPLDEFNLLASFRGPGKATLMLPASVDYIRARVRTEPVASFGTGPTHALGLNVYRKDVLGWTYWIFEHGQFVCACKDLEVLDMILEFHADSAQQIEGQSKFLRLGARELVDPAAEAKARQRAQDYDRKDAATTAAFRAEMSAREASRKPAGLSVEDILGLLD